MGEVICEFKDCREVGWVVLCFGPKKTAPRRVACPAHESETALADFRIDQGPSDG